jgi:signal transduction histidine kinase
VIFAAYSAVAYSKYRRMALLSVTVAAIIVTAAFTNTTPPLPARFTAFLVLLPTVAVALAMRTWRQRAGDSAARLLAAEAEHEAETRRAVEAERARIASELHDVVTHNVSVMVVQAGAARRVLGSSPGRAPEAQTAIEALRAVEASGRTAMGELRHLLGLLAPSGEAPSGDDVVLVPQPDVGQVRSLVERVRAAGLPVELTITGARALPPGVDLAAYRVVQEALTNVIKHASQARTVVRIEYRPHELLIDVADDGRPADAPVPGAAGPAGGRGLIGLRERIAIYGGELDAGPRLGGGWRVQARIPLEPAGSVWPELQVTPIPRAPDRRRPPGALRRRAARPVHHPPPGRAVRPARGFRVGARAGERGPVRPHAARARGSRPGRSRPEQLRARRRADAERGDGQDPRGPDPGQAAAARPGPGGRPGLRDRPGQPGRRRLTGCLS